MTKFGLIVIGILFSTIAQVMIKKSSLHELNETIYFLYLGMAGLSYVFSFVSYAFIMKFFPLSKISPVMTIGTMILVVCSGVILLNETISIRQSLGLMLGIISIILIF